MSIRYQISLNQYRTPLVQLIYRCAQSISALTLVFVITAFSPAHAAKNDCPSGYFCAWEHKNYRGKMQKTRNWRTSLGNMNDKYSSVFNNTDRLYGVAYWVAEHTSCNGKGFWVHKGTSRPDLHMYGWGDKISSVFEGNGYSYNNFCN